MGKSNGDEQNGPDHYLYDDGDDDFAQYFDDPNFTGRQNSLWTPDTSKQIEQDVAQSQENSLATIPDPPRRSDSQAQNLDIH